MDEDLSEMNGDRISIKKVMVNIILVFNVFYIVYLMPDGDFYNSLYFIQNILEPLVSAARNSDLVINLFKITPLSSPLISTYFCVVGIDTALCLNEMI